MEADPLSHLDDKEGFYIKTSDDFVIRVPMTRFVQSEFGKTWFENKSTLQASANELVADFTFDSLSCVLNHSLNTTYETTHDFVMCSLFFNPSIRGDISVSIDNKIKFAMNEFSWLKIHPLTPSNFDKLNIIVYIKKQTCNFDCNISQLFHLLEHFASQDALDELYFRLCFIAKKIIPDVMKCDEWLERCCMHISKWISKGGFKFYTPIWLELGLLDDCHEGYIEVIAKKLTELESFEKTLAIYKSLKLSLIEIKSEKLFKMLMQFNAKALLLLEFAKPASLNVIDINSSLECLLANHPISDGTYKIWNFFLQSDKIHEIDQNLKKRVCKHLVLFCETAYGSSVGPCKVIHDSKLKKELTIEVARKIAKCIKTNKPVKHLKSWLNALIN